MAAVKVYNNLINKDEVLGIIEGIAKRITNNASNNNTLAYLGMAEDCIAALVPINIVAAGDVNIICEDVSDFDTLIKKEFPKKQ